MKEVGLDDFELGDEDEIESTIGEDDFDPSDDIVKPFAPKDIKIIVEPKTIDHLVSRLKHNEIDLNTEFQRKGNLWSIDKQCRLIESIMLRLPLPAFYFDASDDNNWLVVDGLQRLWSLKNFIVNDLPEKQEEKSGISLTGLEILTEYNNNNVTYSALNRTMQRRISETPITTYLIQPGTPKKVKYNVFKRINSGGLGLNPMEIRNALNQESENNYKSPAHFLRDLSENEKLRKILHLQDKRMEDRELILRAYSFINKMYYEYEKPLSVFLDDSIESLNSKSKEELIKIETGIIEAIQFQKDLFGVHIFSRSIITSGKRRINSALFEVWVSEIYKLNYEQRENLIKSRNQLIADYRELFNRIDFSNSVVNSTSGKGAVKIRFEAIRSLIQKYIK
jgi:hypothetical protein